MKSFVQIATVAFVSVLLMGALSGPAQQQAYVPREGDDVVIYISKWKPDRFEMAKQIIKEYGDHMTASGQSRQTYWLADPHSYETVAISFFKKGHSVDAWHTHEGRLKVLKNLELLRQAPQIVHRYQVFGVHNTK